MSRPPLDVSRKPGSPRPDPAFRGVILALDEDSGERARVFGAFQLEASQAESITATPLHRALVLVVASEYHSVAWNLAGDQALFEDDQTVHNGLYTGYFDFELASWIELEHQRVYHATASLGPFLSNTLTIKG